MQIVGAVQYVAPVPRPDISYATGSLARYMSKPTKYLLKCAERLLRYLKGTANYGLVLSCDTSPNDSSLMGYSDSSYVRNDFSTTGIGLCLYGQPVHWHSKRQTTVSTSSTEAEMMAMSMGSLNLKWLKMLTMGDIGILCDSSILFGDNQSAVSVCKDPQSSDPTRHISSHYKKVQELIKDDVLIVQWIPNREMLAGCLTKQLPKPAYESARSRLGVRYMED